MKFSLLFVLMLITAVSQTSFAQSEKELDSIQNSIPALEDSLKVKSYILLFNKTFRKNPELSKTFLDSASQIFKKNGEAENDNLLHNRGKYYNRISDYPRQIEVINQLIAIHEHNQNKKRLASDYNNLGRAQEKMGMFEKAIENTMKSLLIRDELNLRPKEKTSNYLSFVRLYGKIGNIEKSNFYNEKLEKIHLETNDTLGLANDWNNFAVNYKKLKDYSKALHYFKKSIAIYERKQSHYKLALSYNNIGNVYRSISDDSLKIAKNYFLEAKKSGEISKNKSEIAVSLHNLGHIANRQSKFREAIEFLNASKKISLETKHRLLLVSTYSALSNSYSGLKDYKNAYLSTVDRIKLKDSIFKRQSVDKINELEVKYQTEIKEGKIALQENEIDLLEEKAKVSKLQKSLLGTGLLLSLGLIGFSFYGFRQKIKRNKLEKEKIDAELAFKKKELTTHALHLAKKNEVLEGLKLKAEELKNSEASNGGYQQLIRTINFDLKDDNNWENFSKYFQEVHKDFNRNVKREFPNVTSNELRLMSLLKMNLSSKEIANILNISQEGIKKARYRLRKKLNITSEDSLQDLVLSL